MLPEITKTIIPSRVMITPRTMLKMIEHLIDGKNDVPLRVWFLI